MVVVAVDIMILNIVVTSAMVVCRMNVDQEMDLLEVLKMR